MRPCGRKRLCRRVFLPGRSVMGDRAGALCRQGDRPIIEPRRGRKESLLPEKGCIVFVPDDIRLFLKGLRDRISGKRKIFLSNCYIIDGIENGWFIVGPVLGAPQAVMVLEKAVALGVRDLIAFGWCGSLQRNVEIGDVVVPTGFFSEEGTSSHYPSGGSLRKNGEDGGIGFHLLKTLEKEGIPIHRGTLWTTDAPFRETTCKVMFYQKKGVLAVDMESSALARVASYRGVNLTVILIVSDHLHTLKWYPGTKDAIFKERREQIIKAAVQTLDDGGLIGNEG